MQDFRKLKVWQKGHCVTLDVYAATESFPSRELYGLTSQLRRAACSVPANLAEGCTRQSDKDFCRHAFIAMGSASELEYFLLLAHDLKYLPDDRYVSLNEGVTEVKRMLAALIDKLSGKESGQAVAAHSG